MGFWNALGRMVQGKPVFETPVNAEQPATDLPSQPGTPLESGGQKIIPRLDVQHSKSSVNGTNMEVTAWITNPSGLAIELSKVVILGLTTTLDRRLEAGQAHQVVLYHGPVAANDYDHVLKIYYKILQNGDDFCADFTIKYHRQSDGSYLVDELYPSQDIHDL